MTEHEGEATKRFVLTVLRGESRGKEFELGEGSNLIGRWDPDSGSFPEVDLESEDVDSKISRKHAVILRSGEQLAIEDVGSLNGTFLNRTVRLARGERYPLQDGDEIIIGKVFLRLEVRNEASG